MSAVSADLTIIEWTLESKKRCSPAGRRLPHIFPSLSLSFLFHSWRKLYKALCRHTINDDSPCEVFGLLYDILSLSLSSTATRCRFSIVDRTEHGFLSTYLTKPSWPSPNSLWSIPANEISSLQHAQLTSLPWEKTSGFLQGTQHSALSASSKIPTHFSQKRKPKAEGHSTSFAYSLTHSLRMRKAQRPHLGRSAMEVNCSGMALLSAGSDGTNHSAGSGWRAGRHIFRVAKEVHVHMHWDAALTSARRSKRLGARAQGEKEDRERARLMKGTNLHVQ